MSSVVNFSPLRRNENPPLLVLLDMQRQHEVNKGDQVIPAVNNCRRLLRQARSWGFPVAFTRWVGRGAFFSNAPEVEWIDGFIPTRRDLVFERDRPSCYASACFEDAIDCRSNNFVMAGFSGNVACLATIMDAFHRHHLVTYLYDASASEPLNRDSAFDVHRIVVNLASLFGSVTSTDDWIAATSRLASEGGKNGWT